MQNGALTTAPCIAWSSSRCFEVVWPVPHASSLGARLAPGRRRRLTFPVSRSLAPAQAGSELHGD